MGTWITYAGLEIAVSGLATIVVGCGCAGSGALAGVVDAGEEAHADVGALACGVWRCIDRAAKASGSFEAVLCRRSVELAVACKSITIGAVT